MTMPIGIALLFLMAVAPVLPWRKASEEVLAQRLLWPAWAGAVAMAVAVALGARGLGTVLAFGLGAFAGGSAVRQVVLATRRQGWRGLVGRANGGMIVHLGVVIIAVAIATNGHYVHEVGGALRARPDARRRRPRDHLPRHRGRRGAQPHGHQGARAGRRRPGVRAGAVAATRASGRSSARRR